MLYKYQQKSLNIVYIVWEKKMKIKKKFAPQARPALPCFNPRVKRGGLYW